MRRPCVYIVGAGPGDPSLISVRGLRYLQAADVVIYDHPVSPMLLRSARPEAERIDVGAAAPRPMELDAISLLLVEKAREGRLVVRLKWGDPFVFDSGGKEALFLRQQEVPFEVVPGIPAAVGAPSYAGVPVTYPGAGDVLALVRGHEAETDAPPEVDWARLAKLEGTIICYAGVRQLSGIVEALLNHGRPRDDGAALIYNGTLPDQKTVHGTLADIQRVASHPPHRLPAILVVGAVTAFREHLRWFDARPLFGKRVLVTRSREQAPELVDRLAELGAEPVQAPTISIAPPVDYSALDRACAEAGQFDWIVFTSANGVDFFMRRLLAGPGDVRDLKGARLCAIGPATADRLSRFGLKVDLRPTEYQAEAVADALREFGRLEHARVLLPRADLARELLADELRKQGAQLVEVIAYRTVPASPDSGNGLDVYRMLLEKQIDVVTFTSASTVRNFVKMLGAEPAADLLRTTVVASIGPVTAEAAQQLDIHTTIMPSSYTIAALVEAIVAYYEERPA